MFVFINNVKWISSEYAVYSPSTIKTPNTSKTRDSHPSNIQRNIVKNTVAIQVTYKEIL